MPEADTIADPLNGLVRILISVVMLVIWLGGMSGVLWLVHFLLTLPMRRSERARLFLDLLDRSTANGQSVEQTIVSLSRTQDRTMGVRFHLVAAHIENGLRLGQALEQTPGFLPPQISCMLRAGEKLGDIRKVLPAAAELLKDTKAGVRTAIHYLLLLLFVFSPGFIGVTLLLAVSVYPKLLEVAAGLGEEPPPWLAQLVFTHPGALICIEVGIFLFLVALAIFYFSGPRLVRALNLSIVDWIAWHVPWKRKRLQRTFSAMLSVLLDTGVPEPEAVLLAGECTANEICQRRAGAIVTKLKSGIKLEEAVSAFDDTGEFHWRLANAARARGGFLNALRGWHESLDAKAFQQQEATAHVLTTGLVVLNGALVALIAMATFGMLIAILEKVAP